MAGGDNAPWLACDGLTRDFALELLNDLIVENADSLKSLNQVSSFKAGSAPRNANSSPVHSLASLLSQSLPVVLDRLYRTRRIFSVMVLSSLLYISRFTCSQVRVLRLTLTLAQALPAMLFAHPKVLLVVLQGFEALSLII